MYKLNKLIQLSEQKVPQMSPFPAVISPPQSPPPSSHSRSPLIGLTPKLKGLGGIYETPGKASLSYSEFIMEI